MDSGTGQSSGWSSGWTVVLPLKGGTAAKSRLGGGPGLARAIALDCLEAVLGATTVHRVLVITPDPDLGAAAGQLGAEVLPEAAVQKPVGSSGDTSGDGSGGGTGLLAAIGIGLAAASGASAVLLGDLPALHPEDLDAALAACAGHQAAFVPDADGEGTVLLAGRRPGDLRPRFGPGSALAHESTGAVRLELALPRLRRDVDTPADLARARGFGLGPRTTAALPGDQGIPHRTLDGRG